jgi:hypothetical protein
MQTPQFALAGLALTVALAGCSSTSPLIGNREIAVSPHLYIVHEALVGAAIVGAAVWYVTDPMAPTWKIERRKLAEDRYRIDLRQKRFAVGGDGEARQIFQRAAESLAEDTGFPGYTIVSYTEGFEASTPIGQRVSRGVVQLKWIEEAELGR